MVSDSLNQLSKNDLINDNEDAKSDRSDNIYGLVELLTDTSYKEIVFEHKGF